MLFGLALPRVGSVVLICAAPAPAASQPTAAVTAPFTVSIVGQRVAADDGTVLRHLGALQSQTTVDRDDLIRWAPRRLEDLTGLLPGTVVEPLNAGLSTALKVRGFAVTRLHYNGSPDIQRMFSRDLSTVDRVEVLRGPAAALLGITSSGGSVNYVGKRPTGTDSTVLSLTAGSHHQVRLTLDKSGRWGSAAQGVDYRLITTAEDGQSSWASLPRRRHLGMLVIEKRYVNGLLGIDLQLQRSQSPFSFGTVITNGAPAGSPSLPAQVAWDRLFVLEGGAPSDRRYHDARIRWRHSFGDGVELNVSFGTARVQRDETLIGYWTITSTSTVSSYYTDYQDRYRQTSGRVEVKAQVGWGAWRHELRAGLDGYSQRFLFEGVQNIGAVTTSVFAPDFRTVDPASIDLFPRYNDEKINEEAAWLANRVQLKPLLSAVAAVRSQRYAIASDRVREGRRRVAQDTATTWFAGLDWRFGDAWRTWASMATGMEPNRGNTASGGYLPAQTSRQTEWGLEASSGPASGSMALWQIGLDNVAMTDPADRTAVIAAGQRQVKGAELLARWSAHRWTVFGNASFQQTRHLIKTSATLGDRFVGVPRASGGLQIQAPLALTQGLMADLSLGLIAVGSRAGNASNTVQVPGFVRTDVGLSLALAACRLSLGIRNLGDIRYVSAVTAVDDVFQGARRQAWISIAATL